MPVPFPAIGTERRGRPDAAEVETITRGVVGADQLPPAA